MMCRGWRDDRVIVNPTVWMLLSSSPLQEPCQTARGLQSFLGFQSQASAFIGLANPVYCDAASMLSKGWNKVGLPLGHVALFTFSSVKS